MNIFLKKSNRYFQTIIISLLAVLLILVGSVTTINKAEKAQAAASLPLPGDNLPEQPTLQPSVITGLGRRYLLDYYEIFDRVSATYNSTTKKIEVTPSGWTLINYPLQKIQGFTGLTSEQIAIKVFGKPLSEIKNWYFSTPGNSTEADWRAKAGTRNINPNPSIYIDNTNSSASDSNSGSINSPKKTIQAGIDATLAGQTVQVVAGKYTEIFEMNRDGSVDKPIILEGKLNSNNDLPWIDLPGNSKIMINGAYNTIRNFKITDGPAIGEEGLQNPQLEVVSTPLRYGQIVEHNLFVDAIGRAIRVTSSVGASGVATILRGNIILGSGVEGISVANDPIFNNQLNPTNVNAAPGYSKALIEYNFIDNSNTRNANYGWEAGTGKMLWNSNTIIRYNESNDSNGFGWWFDWENYNNTIEGNLVSKAKGMGIAVGEASPGPNLALNNIVINTLPGWPTGEIGTSIGSWDSTRGRAYNNTMDGSNNAGVSGINLYRTGKNSRGTSWMIDTPGDPYNGIYESDIVNNVMYNLPGGGSSSGIPATINLNNYDNLNAGDRYGNLNQISMANSFTDPTNYNYTLTEDSNLSNLGDRSAGLRYSNKDFNSLLRNISGDNFSVGAHRSNAKTCVNTGTIEFETINNNGYRMCQIADGTFIGSSTSTNSTSFFSSSIISSSINPNSSSTSSSTSSNNSNDCLI